MLLVPVTTVTPYQRQFITPTTANGHKNVCKIEKYNNYIVKCVNGNRSP